LNLFYHNLLEDGLYPKCGILSREKIASGKGLKKMVDKVDLGDNMGKLF